MLKFFANFFFGKSNGQQIVNNICKIKVAKMICEYPHLSEEKLKTHLTYNNSLL